MSPSILPYKDKLFKESFNFTDGEAIYSVSIHGIIVLLLPGEHPRNIGFLANDSKGEIEYYITRNPELHLFQKLNAYGINHKIMEVFDPERIVVYIVNKTGKTQMKVIDKDSYKMNAKFLHFKKQNFELQKFIGVEYLRPFDGKKTSSNSLI